MDKGNPMRASLIIGALALGLAAITPAKAESENTVIVFDSSGSMWGQIDGVTKIEIARSVVGDLLRDWDPARHLGVVAYGHRQAGRCDDIETVIEVGPLDLDRALSTINRLQPRGRTPLTEAVRMAAEDLSYEDKPATVILLSDGVETCNADPCALGRELAQRGVKFTAHVIGFDIGEGDRADLACLAEATGGLFLPADNARELSSALTQVVAVRSVPEEPAPEEIVPEPAPEEPAPPELTQATLDAPDEVPAGSSVSIAWTGPDNKSDYITIVEAGAPAGAYNDYARTAAGSPVAVMAPDAIGNYEVRYVEQGSSRTVAARPIKLIPVEATIDAPDEAPAGSQVTVHWRGPDNRSDYLTIVEAGAPEGSYDNYIRTATGSPVELVAPDGLGNYEIRYVVSQSGRTLAARPIRLIPVEATIDAPDEVPAGSQVTVHWTGPDNRSDYLTIVEVGAPEGSYNNYVRTATGSPVQLVAPDGLGNYEIRYVVSQSGRTLAARPLRLAPVSGSVEALSAIVPDGRFQVAWEGPDNPNDYITIVAAGAPEGSYKDYARTRSGNPVQLRAPAEPGEYEIRYVIQQSGRTLATRAVTVGGMQVTLSVKGKVSPGGVVEVEWTGPGRYEDFIQIVPAGSADDAPALRETRSTQGSPLQLFAPPGAGEFELRYRSSDSGEVLARMPLPVGRAD
jgi:Ca-activated chloride channel homolog